MPIGNSLIHDRVEYRRDIPNRQIYDIIQHKVLRIVASIPLD